MLANLIGQLSALFLAQNQWFCAVFPVTSHLLPPDVLEGESTTGASVPYD